jgi:hypothetical protein
MVRNVRALPMGPFSRSHRHGPPVLDRVQGCPCSPTSLLVCSPPTPCLHRPWLRSPLPVASLDAGASSVPHGPTTRVPANVPCVGDGSPALRHPGISRGEARASQVARPSSSSVLWSNTPPHTAPSSPTSRRGPLLPSRIPARSASGKQRLRGRRPTARTFAGRRIADGMSATVARLATGRAGSP